MMRFVSHDHFQCLGNFWRNRIDVQENYQIFLNCNPSFDLKIRNSLFLLCCRFSSFYCFLQYLPWESKPFLNVKSLWKLISKWTNLHLQQLSTESYYHKTCLQLLLFWWSNSFNWNYIILNLIPKPCITCNDIVPFRMIALSKFLK